MKIIKVIKCHPLAQNPPYSVKFTVSYNYRVICNKTGVPVWSQLDLLLHHWLVWSWLGLPISIDIIWCLNTWVYGSLALIGSPDTQIILCSCDSRPQYEVSADPPGGWRPRRVPRRSERRSCGVSGPERGSPPCPGDILARGAGEGAGTSPCQPPHCSWWLTGVTSACHCHGNVPSKFLNWKSICCCPLSLCSGIPDKQLSLIVWTTPRTLFGHFE